jgi:hypothetical protein
MNGGWPYSEGAVGSGALRRSMKYKTKTATEITNAAKNINRAISAVANARTPSPRNPATSDTIENRTARHERIIHFLLSILIISLILASGDSPL